MQRVTAVGKQPPLPLPLHLAVRAESLWNSSGCDLHFAVHVLVNSADKYNSRQKRPVFKLDYDN